MSRLEHFGRQRAAKLRMLLTDDVRPEVAVGTRAVPLLSQSLRHIDHDRHRNDVMASRELDQRARTIMAAWPEALDARSPGRTEPPGP